MSHPLKSLAPLFTCPVCLAAMDYQPKRLVCTKGHSFDIAKQHYINLILNNKPDKHYDKLSFARRHDILEAGFYDPILKAIAKEISNDDKTKVILDVACGEGYYARQLAQNKKNHIIAFDLSKQSIRLAAQKDTEKRVTWFVGDLAKLPLADSSVDVILDIYSPANYQEFKRVLKPGGKLIKVVTASEHVSELRQAAFEQLRNKTYSNAKILHHFSQAFPNYHKSHLTTTHPATQKELLTFAQMTPLFFHVNLDKIDWQDLNEITIAADMLIAETES
ncbi:methyltransferase domain-containing protein [Streptococcus halotolerans]|uniref:methyltransferase domain-containing protein n=1 Tax=Streptococcus halotolerans TaxID=1814128 RepID=UPI000787D1E9|nr:methyltransferase domain-containing protein [Streptococcus halotolerans]